MKKWEVIVEFMNHFVELPDDAVVIRVDKEYGVVFSRLAKIKVPYPIDKFYNLCYYGLYGLYGL